MSVNNTNVYSFKTTEDTLRNYRIYGNNKYGANYRIYGNTIDGSSVGNLKNLANPNDLQQGYYAYADGSSALGNLKWVCTKKIPCKSNTNYTFSFKNPSRWAGFVWYDSSDTYISTSNRDSGFTNGGYYTAQSPSNAAYFVVDIAGYPDVNADITVDNIIDLMIEEGSTPSEYEPYRYKVPIRVTGKNLLKRATNRTLNGVTFTVNSDGSVTCNGTASALTFYATHIYLQKGSYIISGCPQNGGATSYMVTMRNGINNECYTNINGDDTGNSKLMTITEYLYFRYVIKINSGYTCDNLTFYPMIRKADIEDSTYEPYREQVEYLYLDSPLIKSGDNCDYIDFKEQKRVNIDGTEEYIKLPELKIESENDSIFIDTDIQPSNVDFDILHGVGDRTENLFDVTKTNRVLSMAYEGDGSIITTKNSNYFNYYIPVLSNTTYTVKTNGNVPSRIYYFDKNKTWFGRSEYADTGTSRTFITPNNCYYIMFQESKTFTMNENSIMLVEGSNVPSEYEPYGYKVPIRITGKNLFNSSVDQGGLKRSDGTEYTSGQYYTNRLRSDHINLTSNKTYTISSNMKIKIIVAYNENKYISCLLNNNEDLLYSTITLPFNANNIRVVFWSGTNDTAVEPLNFEWCQIEEGGVVTEYEEPFSSTNNIYLNRPLLNDGSEYDYIDYLEQKRYNYDGTIENISMQHVLTNNGMNTLTFDSLVQPLQSFIKYYDEDAEIPIIDSLKSFEASFTTSGTQLLNYRIWGTDSGLGNTNLFDFDAWWETIKNNVSNGSVKREKNQSFTITPTAGDAYTRLYSSSSTGGYKIYVEPNSSYTFSWNKECSNNSYYGSQIIFLDGGFEYMYTCTNSTSMTFTTRSDTSFIMLRFGAGANNTDTPITFSNITLCKNNSNPNMLLNISDLNNIATWDNNLLPKDTNIVVTNSFAVGQVIDVTNINSLYIIGDLKLVDANVLRIGKSNNPITSGSSILFTTMEPSPCIIDTSDCNYILISVYIYSKNTTVEQIKNTFKIYKAQPNTTIITLPRKLYKTDTNIEYIDYESQKLYNTDNTSTNISLPPIPTVVGKNKLRIPPDKQPSKLMIKYLT